jgi:hypothetical protein
MIEACPGGWQAGTTEYTVRLLASPSCYEAYYSYDGYVSGMNLAAKVKKNCDGTYEVANPWTLDGPPSAAGGWPDAPWIPGWWNDPQIPASTYAACDPDGSRKMRQLRLYPLISVEPIMTPQPYELTVKSVTPSEVPASGGVVTVVTGGVQDRTFQHTIGPNKARFSITKQISPYYTRRIADLGPGGIAQGILYTDFTPQLGGYNLPPATITQKGYGGDADDKCIADPIWINASGIFMPNQLALNRGDIPTVYADFTKERCLVCQPTTLEGSACEWTATGSESWMKITKKDGLFTLTIDPGVEYTLGPVCSYASGLTGTVTVGTQKESETWTVCIKME